MTTLTYQNSTQEDNYSTLQSGNACCHLAKNLLSSSLLPQIIKIKTLRTVILSFILYGYENWSLILKEENLLRVIQNKVLRRIFGPERDKVTGEWREPYNEVLNELNFSPNIIRVIES